MKRPASGSTGAPVAKAVCTESTFCRGSVVCRVGVVCVVCAGDAEMKKWRQKIRFINEHARGDPFQKEVGLASDLLEAVEWGASRSDAEVEFVFCSCGLRAVFVNGCVQAIAEWDAIIKKIDFADKELRDSNMCDAWFGAADAVTRKVSCLLDRCAGVCRSLCLL